MSPASVNQLFPVLLSDFVSIEGILIVHVPTFRFIFPGLALGAALGQTGVVTNGMINKSAEALVELITEKDLARRATFPENKDIRAIAAHLATRVIQQAVDEGLRVSSNTLGVRSVSGSRQQCYRSV